MAVLVISRLVLLATAASAAVVVIQAGNPTAPDNPDKLSFIPAVTKVEPTDTVRFMFMGNHTVTQQATFDDCTPGAGEAGGTPFDSGVKTRGETFELPASALVPGATINYYCRINDGAHCKSPNFMQGAIVVGNGAEAAGSASPATEAAEGAVEGNGKTITIEVGKDSKNQYSPSEVEAAPGDTIMFSWVGTRPHNVVPSDAPESCERSTKIETDPTLKSLFSGEPQTNGTKAFVVPANANAGDVMSFFCSVGTHCSAGKMFGKITVASGAEGATSSTTGADGTASATGTESTAGGDTGATAGATDAGADGGEAAADGTANSSTALSAQGPPGTIRSSASGVTASLAVVGSAVGAVIMLA